MHVLLIEPEYYTQYPPLGLLKLSSYHKQKGDTVQYLKGASGIRHLYTYPDLIYVTSLFTWAWEPVHRAIKVARLYFPKSRIELGGVYASLRPDHAATAGADYVHTGILPHVEGLLPDYDLVPDWHRKRRASVMFTHRGCIRRCQFCAVPALEGQPFQVRDTGSIKPLVHPEHNRVILWDNNILGESHWQDIVGEIKDLNLEVDFNQGLDARLINEDVAEAFRGLKMPVIRIAYDFPGMGKSVKRAIELLEWAGFSRRNIVSYVLFNFRDNPEQLFTRVRDLLSWGATAYPMRFQPLDALEKDRYIADNWTQEELSLVATARRVIGYGGAFPPYEGLVRKFLEAKKFEDAFGLWEEQSGRKISLVRSRKDPLVVYFGRRHLVGGAGKAHPEEVKFRPLGRLTVSAQQAAAGRFVVMVSNFGRVKKTPVLGVLSTMTGHHLLPLGTGEEVVSVDLTRDNGCILMISAQGRVGLFEQKKIAPRPLSTQFIERFLLDEGDRVVFSKWWTTTEWRLLVVADHGEAQFVDVSRLRSYRSTGRGIRLRWMSEVYERKHYALLLGDSTAKIGFRLSSGKRKQVTINSKERLKGRPFALLNLHHTERIVGARVVASYSRETYKRAMDDMARDHGWLSEEELQWSSF